MDRDIMRTVVHVAVVAAILVAPGCRCSAKSGGAANPAGAGVTTGVGNEGEVAKSGAEKAPGPAPKAGSLPEIAQPTSTNRQNAARIVPDDEIRPQKWPAVPVDVLVRVVLPLLDAAGVESKLRALNVTLRSGRGVEHVWMRAAAGEARLVVRTTAIGPSDAVKLVEQRLSDAEIGLEATWESAAVARGVHSVAAVSIDGNAGRQQVTREWLQPVAKILAAVKNGAGLELCGALREQVTLAYEPNAMANLRVSLGDAMKLVRKVAVATGPLDERLRTISMKHASGTPVSADRVVVQSGGIGEPGACEAFVGYNPSTIAFVRGAPGASEAVVNGVATVAVAALRKTIGKEGRVFHHHLAVSERFLLVARDGAEPEPTSALRKRLKTVASDPGIIDLLAISGIDGVPSRVSPLAQRRAVWTVWMALDNPAAAEVPISSLRDAVKDGGWRVHGLPRGYDVALSWLLGAWGSTGLVAVARDPQRLAGPVSSAASMADGNVSIGDRRTGPRRRGAPGWFARLDREKARKSGVSGADIAAVISRIGRPRFVGVDGERRIYEGFAGGILKRQFGKLPIGKGVAFGSLRQLAEQTQTLDRISRDGRPAFWYLQSAVSVRADSLADDFARVARLRIAPIRGVSMVFMRVGDAPIEPKRTGR